MYLGNNKNWHIFPSVETLAYYHPLGNFILLNKISESELKEVLKNPIQNTKHYSVIIHELQHWLDHVGTLWGQKKVLKIFKAFASSFAGDEQRLFTMKEAYDAFKRDRLSAYYSETYNYIQGNKAKRWRYTFSTGIKFNHEGKLDNSKSIVFVRFNSSDDQPISRVPLSVASLLETTATNSELGAILLHLESMSENERIVELKMLSDKLGDSLYNPELTLYSVAVHTASNLLKISDPIVGYRIASKIATLSLNLPSSYIKNIKVPKQYHDAWGDRNGNMLNAEDRGFLFFCLIKNYSDDFGIYEQDKFNIEDVLRSSNLPTIEILEKKIAEESMALIQEAFVERNPFINILMDKFRTGNDARKLAGIAQEKSGAVNAIDDGIGDLPYVLCNDTYFEYDEVVLQDAITKAASGKEISRKEWWRIFEFCEKKIDEFSEICGV